MAQLKRMLGVYWTGWNGGGSLTNVDLDYNHIFLFAYTKKAGTLATLEWGYSPILDVQTVRQRGQKVIISTGGAGQGINFANRAVSQEFVTSVQAIATQLGGVDGLDFNTFEAQDYPNLVEYQWMARELKRIYGPQFIITSPPAPWNVRDMDFCRAMLASGDMDFVSPQYYDGGDLAVKSYVEQTTTEWIRDIAGGDASKIGIGLGIQTGQPNYMTTAEAVATYKSVVATHPNLRGAFLWERSEDANANWAFANAMGTAIAAEPKGNARLDTLSDSFSTNTRATSWSGSYGNVAIASGVATVSAELTASQYNALQTPMNADTLYDFRDSYAHVRMTTPASLASNPTIGMTLMPMAPPWGTQIRFNWDQYGLYAGSKVDYGWVPGMQSAGIPLGVNASIYIGVAEGLGRSRFGGVGVKGNLYFYTSPDGVTWTQVLTGPSPSWINAVGVAFTAETYAAGTITSTWDNFNYRAPAADAGLDIAVNPWSTVTLTGVGTGTWSQVSGTAVTLGGTGNVRTFVAPPSMTNQSLVFSFGGDQMTVVITAAKMGIVASNGTSFTPVRITML